MLIVKKSRINTKQTIPHKCEVYLCDYNGEKAIMKIVPYSEELEKMLHEFNKTAAKYDARFLTLRWSASDMENLSLIYTPFLKYTLRDIKYKLSVNTRQQIFSHLCRTLQIMHAAGWAHNAIKLGHIMCDTINTASSYVIINYNHIADKTTYKATGKTTNGLTLPVATNFKDATAADFLALARILAKNPVRDILEKKKTIHTLAKSCAIIKTKYNAINDKTNIDPQLLTLVHKLNKKFDRINAELLLLHCMADNYALYALAIGASPAMVKKYATYCDPFSQWVLTPLYKLI